TRDALLRGRRRYNGKITSYNLKPKLPLPGAAATGFALSDMWGTLKARECHVIVDGEVWTGRFAVWRYPAMLASDIEVWTATKPLPSCAKYIPNNCIICSREGGGAVNLGDGDYDGDELMICGWDKLLDFLDNTPSELSYRDFCSRADTAPVRGRACAMAERAQHVAFKSLIPAGDGSLLLAVSLAQVAHMAYDVPKKYNAEAVLGLGAALLSDAGISPRAERASTEIVESLQMGYEDPVSQLPAPGNFPGRPVTAGMVWMPRREVKLSAEAGAALRGILLRPRGPFDGLEDDATRVPLEAVGGLVAHRLVNSVGNLRDHAESEDPAFLLSTVPEATLRCKEMGTWNHLLNCQLRF
ncbi:unnamed protein product, partial [Symbiodinium necroappetens]